MKKSGVLLMVLILLFCTAGCREKAETEEPERLYCQPWSKFCRIGGNTYFARKGQLNQDNLWYYDNQSKACAPLCGKPECMHNTSDCGAWLDQSYGPGSSDGYFYWINTHTTNKCIVNRMNADGTKRTEIREIPALSELPTGNMMTLYDSNNLYLCGNKSTVKDGQYVSATQLLVYGLDGTEEIVLYNEETEVGVPYIQIYKDYLYFSSMKLEITEEDGESCTRARYDVRRYKLGTWEEEILYLGDPGFVPFELFVLDDWILISPASFGTNQIYAYDFETRQIRPELVFSSEEDYEMIYLEENRIIGYSYPNYPDFSVKKVKVMDFEGKVLLEKESEEKMRRSDGTFVYGRSFMGSDQAGLYFCYEDNESIPGTFLQRIVRIDLSDGGEVELTEYVYPADGTSQEEMVSETMKSQEVHVIDWTEGDRFPEYDGTVSEEEIEKARKVLYDFMQNDSTGNYGDTLPLLVPTTHLPLSRTIEYLQEKYRFKGPDQWIAFICGSDSYPGYILVKDENRDDWRVVYWGIGFGQDLETNTDLPVINSDEFDRIETMAREKLYSWLNGKENAPRDDFKTVFRLNYRFFDEDETETILFRPTTVKYSSADIARELRNQLNTDPESGICYCIEIDEGGWPLYFTFFRDESGEWHLIEKLYGNLMGS